MAPRSSRRLHGAHPPCCINLEVDNLSPPTGAQATVTANADIPVDNTGYEIQIYDLSPDALLGTCSTGSSCQATDSDPSGSCTPSTCTFQAFVDKGSQGSAIPS